MGMDNTRKSFHTELQELQADILHMATLVADAIERAVRSLKERDVPLAQEVVAQDDILDNLQIDIENRCLNLLALQQPMASDLRLIGTALKIVTDLERMGDHAVDIAGVTIRLGGQELIKPLVDIPRMAEVAETMIQDAVRAYVDHDATLAAQLAQRDQEVDHLYSQVFRELLTYMMEDPRKINQGLYLILVASYLERIGDHATNLAEWIVYMVTGERPRLNA